MVGLTVKCKNNGNPLRTVEVFVQAVLPRDSVPAGGDRTGRAGNVVCDGVVPCGGRDRPGGPVRRRQGLGRGHCWISPPSGTAKDKEWITIVHVDGGRHNWTAPGGCPRGPSRSAREATQPLV